MFEERAKWLVYMLAGEVLTCDSHCEDSVCFCLSTTFMADRSVLLVAQRL
jgi:hypothetical protein